MKIDIALVAFVKKTSSGISLWFQKRNSRGPLNQLWEFPGGKIESGESPEEAAVREVREETGTDIRNIPLTDLGTQSFQYDWQETDRSLMFHLFACSEPVDLPPEGRWVEFVNKSEKYITELETPDGTRPLIMRVLEEFDSL